MIIHGKESYYSKNTSNNLLSGRFLVGLLLSLTLINITGCYPSFSYSEPIHIKLVDSVTKEPIEGVIATALWARGVRVYPGHAGFVDYQEGISDENGMMQILANGPWFNFFTAVESEPNIYLYHDNYRSYNIKEGSDSFLYRTDNGSAKATKDTVEMEPIKILKRKNDPGSRELYLTTYFKIKDHAKEKDPCIWKHVPKTLVTYQHIFEEQSKKKPDSDVYRNIDVFRNFEKIGCGDPRKEIPKEILEMYSR